LRPRRRRDRRYALLAFAVLAALLSLSLLVATTARLRAPPVATSGSLPRTATIAFERTGDRCRHLVFENDTGRMAELSKPCEVAMVRPEQEAKGTAGRLDAISRG